jgi:hypothetical protein
MMLSFGNSKLKKDGIASFSLPAISSCPMAGTCKLGCYAKQGFFNMPSVVAAYDRNFKLAKTNKFYPAMKEEITKHNPKIIRIHASGDFFNVKYFHAWVVLARNFPNIKFYAYTKMIFMVKKYKQDLISDGHYPWPSNFTIIFSYGGKQDDMISDNNDRHSRVFSSMASLKKAGYADVTSHDTGAMGNNHKIGLVYHGSKKKAWATNV